MTGSWTDVHNALVVGMQIATVWQSLQDGSPRGRSRYAYEDISSKCRLCAKDSGLVALWLAVKVGVWLWQASQPVLVPPVGAEPFHAGLFSILADLLK